jgi:hypothetical protein
MHVLSISPGWPRCGRYTQPNMTEKNLAAKNKAEKNMAENK